MHLLLPCAGPACPTLADFLASNPGYSLVAEAIPGSKPCLCAASHTLRLASARLPSPLIGQLRLSAAGLNDTDLAATLLLPQPSSSLPASAANSTGAAASVLPSLVTDRLRTILSELLLQDVFEKVGGSAAQCGPQCLPGSHGSQPSLVGCAIALPSIL